MPDYTNRPSWLLDDDSLNLNSPSLMGTPISRERPSERQSAAAFADPVRRSEHDAQFAAVIVREYAVRYGSAGRRPAVDRAPTSDPTHVGGYSGPGRSGAVCGFFIAAIRSGPAAESPCRRSSVRSRGRGQAPA